MVVLRCGSRRSLSTPSRIYRWIPSAWRTWGCRGRTGNWPVWGRGSSAPARPCTSWNLGQKHARSQSRLYRRWIWRWIWIPVLTTTAFKLFWLDSARPWINFVPQNSKWRVCWSYWNWFPSLGTANWMKKNYLRLLTLAQLELLWSSGHRCSLWAPVR